jgi:hypothetical protein
LQQCVPATRQRVRGTPRAFSDEIEAMQSPANISLRIDRSLVVGLLMSCPATNGNPPDCPLHGVRLLPLRERYEWLRSQTEDELVGIVCAHTGCKRNATPGSDPAQDAAP